MVDGIIGNNWTDTSPKYSLHIDLSSGLLPN